jgi:hypothetical protein
LNPILGFYFPLFSRVFPREFPSGWKTAESSGKKIVVSLRTKFSAVFCGRRPFHPDQKNPSLRRLRAHHPMRRTVGHYFIARAFVAGLATLDYDCALRKSIGTEVVGFYRPRQEPVPWIGLLGQTSKRRFTVLVLLLYGIRRAAAQKIHQPVANPNPTYWRC